MRILADHCVPPSLVKSLQEKGIEVIHLKEIGLERLPDEAVFNFAIKNSLILFTFDHGFGDTSRFDIRNSPGVIIIYTEKMGKATIFERTIYFFRTIREEKLRGKLHIIEPDRIRTWPK
jgi:predicted nuclease of predicted toxin-antitoxin system